MKKEALFKIITILLSIFLMMIVFEIGVRVYEAYKPYQTADKGMYKFDDKIGWTLVDGTFSQVHQDFNAKYSIKNGIRVTKQNNQI